MRHFGADPIRANFVSYLGSTPNEAETDNGNGISPQPSPSYSTTQPLCDAECYGDSLSSTDNDLIENGRPLFKNIDFY